MRKHAFTLIELLVVIAIIAILAAILFPVFAQAKAAAKAISSVSNDKQNALGILMYTNDYDDTAPLDMTWGDHNSLYWFGSWNSAFLPWSYAVLPYEKNGNIYEDPQTQINGPATVGVPEEDYLAYNPEYGYNYTALSPILNTNGTPPEVWVRTPASMTSFSRPAETVLISADVANAEATGCCWWWGPGTMYVSSYQVEAPDCNDIAPLCQTNWGTGSWYATFWTLNDNIAAGAVTGRNSMRTAKEMVLSFVDGHTKRMQGGQAAAGTNWSLTLPASQLVMVNSSKYLWGNFQ